MIDNSTNSLSGNFRRSWRTVNEELAARMTILAKQRPLFVTLTAFLIPPAAAFSILDDFADVFILVSHSNPPMSDSSRVFASRNTKSQRRTKKAIGEATEHGVQREVSFHFFVCMFLSQGIGS